MRRAGALLLILASGLALAASPASAATRGALPDLDPFTVPRPSIPFRDRVIERPSVAAARETASSTARRYPVHDGKGRTVTIGVSGPCSSVCTAADPQRIADFLGGIAHGAEISLLRVQLVTNSEMAGICGSGALACYFPGQNQMFLSGNDDVGADGATREFVLTHEYGHHLADHRLNPPFSPTVDWGTKRWATYERVCQGARAGALVPGDEGADYYRNPGEAFAEAFAFNRFRNLVGWQWTSLLRPNGGSFAAIRQDALHPWKHRVRSVVAGVLGAGGAQRRVVRIPTSLDGVLSLGLSSSAGVDFDLVLRDNGGRVLRSSESPGPSEAIDYTICGQAKVKASVVRITGSGRFRLLIKRP